MAKYWSGGDNVRIGFSTTALIGPYTTLGQITSSSDVEVILDMIEATDLSQVKEDYVSALGRMSEITLEGQFDKTIQDPSSGVNVFTAADAGTLIYCQIIFNKMPGKYAIAFPCYISAYRFMSLTVDGLVGVGFTIRPLPGQGFSRGNTQ